MASRARSSAIVAAALVALFGLSLRSPAQDPVTDAQDPDVVEEETVLQTNMLVVEAGLRKLRRSVRDTEKKAESLATLAELQTVSIVCKAEIPPMAEALEGEARAKFLADYRKEMIAMERLLLDLEVAVIDGDVEASKELYKEIAAMEDSGHEVYVDGE